ncbi:Minf_1886 family protein [Candidatus Latescibacterota bacterium]
MISNVEFLKKIEDIAEKDKRYRKEMYLFILAALEYTISKLPERRHVTGQELSFGVAEYAREKYGYMARLVLNNWGVKTTADFGEIVYLMIEQGIMSKIKNDSKSDFTDVFSFDKEFNWERFRPSISSGRI